MNNINVYLIRHAESEGNKCPDKIGQKSDVPLTETGKKQAYKLGYFTKISDPVFIASSSYKRAIDTASIVAETAEWDNKIHITDALIEYNPGEFLGRSRAEVFSDIDTLKKVAYQHMGFQFPSGESFHQVARRASAYIEDNIIYNKAILERAEKKEIDCVLFSHGITITSILHWIMGFDQSFHRAIKIQNASICHLHYNDKGWHLNTLNDTSHLTNERVVYAG